MEEESKDEAVIVPKSSEGDTGVKSFDYATETQELENECRDRTAAVQAKFSKVT